MKYTTIFIDLDDTLIDTYSNAKETLEEIYVKYGIDQYYDTHASFLNVYFSNNYELWEKYGRGEIDKNTLQKERFTAPFIDFDDVTESLCEQMNTDYLARIKNKGRTIEGAQQVLDYLKRKYELHIISNGFQELQYTKMQSAQISSYFGEVFLSDMVGASKPHPDIFHHALNKTNTNVREAVMIGDSLTADIAGAKGVGIDQIWYNPEGSKSKLEPTYTIRRLIEILDIL